MKAFRDTWKDGIHSYLTYLRDRLTAMRDLLTESGSIFVQIGDENVHRVRAVMDEVFGRRISSAQITFEENEPHRDRLSADCSDYIFGMHEIVASVKFRHHLTRKESEDA